MACPRQRLARVHALLWMVRGWRRAPDYPSVSADQDRACGGDGWHLDGCFRALADSDIEPEPTRLGSRAEHIVAAASRIQAGNRIPYFSGGAVLRTRQQYRSVVCEMDR